MNGQIDAYIDSSFVVGEPPFAGSTDWVGHTLKLGEFGMPENVVHALDYNFVRCENKALAEAMNEEMKALQTSGRWSEILKANGLTEENKSPLKSPEQLCP
jgi:ABC-type amino acid transport substrate-binding protein